ncbi:MAG: hypothetical protein A3C06_03315 [Candidatus Taylorbacteria bacterium RIFCSPHIGHO2_02_FULL_46_13]|uniref:Uncharacterized protein n=1 Tax=Candidatus Taylorbacteria bacterium RIFCSPHIGHO2_02_FULL_46_13 TaxID=1802312 RepID=A0A1G2MS65_9BACT|nr:MAG: hypothetical protein A3C06_03315 [Candidatus Taylorbacteria bacterium RIFCSPHIGHO2_02_FULL_46_13]
MKKAREYVLEFERAGRTAKAAEMVLCDMLGEVAELAKLRKAERSSSMFAILNEIDDKWESFVTQAKIPQCRYAFGSLQLQQFEQVYWLWVNAFPNKRVPAPYELGHAQTDPGLHKIAS